MSEIISVWRPPTRREACSCTECYTCPDDQTMQDAWPLWYVFNWIPKRALCAVIGHKTDKYTGKNQCARCMSRKITVNAKLPVLSRRPDEWQEVPSSSKWKKSS